MGNTGYVGSVVVKHLRAAFPDATLVGFDSGYFAACLTPARVLPECVLDAQYFGDVRELPESILQDATGIVFLAAISNDPMGKAHEQATLDINHSAALEVARKAKNLGVRSFVFASSCSAYGFAEDRARTEKSVVDPLTAYARSKVFAERDLETLADSDFQVTCLRFATACGMSDRLRLDLVVNDFVASAVAAKKITILSDGTPWRPLIHVRDMARAIEWALERPGSNGGDFLVVNTGSDRWNYQVKTLAESVAQIIPNIEVSINTAAIPDRRSYQVDFALFRRLAPNHQPQVDLPGAIKELRAGLEDMNFQDADFRKSNLMRLNMLSFLRARNLLNPELRWSAAPSLAAADVVR